MSLTLIGLM